MCWVGNLPPVANAMKVLQACKKFHRIGYWSPSPVKKASWCRNERQEGLAGGERVLREEGKNHLDFVGLSLLVLGQGREAEPDGGVLVWTDDAGLGRSSKVAWSREKHRFNISLLLTTARWQNDGKSNQ